MDSASEIDKKVCLHCKKPITDDREYICLECIKEFERRIKEKYLPDGETAWSWLLGLIVVADIFGFGSDKSKND